MSIFVVGINHQTAPIMLREKIYFNLDKTALYLQDFLSQTGALEAVLLSTCNRSELYCHAEDSMLIKEWFCSQGEATPALLKNVIYVYKDEEAIAHIMKVACGLDSMVLGEPQILGQMKQAFSESCSANAVSTLFHRLFQEVFAVAKEIRTTTAIGACPVSVASAAVHFAKTIVQESWAQQKVVVIGAGETAQIMLRYLVPEISQPIVLNRDYQKAALLTEQVGGTAYSLDQLIPVLAEADVVFSATGSLQPIINQKTILEALTTSRANPLVLIDLAVPRDIDSKVAELPQVLLYCIDDLKSIIARNRLGREHAALKAKEMIIERGNKLMTELLSLDKVAHAICAYRTQIENICRAELQKAKRELRQGVDPQHVLDSFAYTFTKKLLHAPSVKLRQAGMEGRYELLRFAKQLFAISEH